MPNLVAETAGSRLNLTSTGTIKGNGTLVGIWVSSATATPTIKVADVNGNIANTFTPTGPNYYKLPFAFSGDCTITISGTVDCTVGYNV